MTVKETQHCPVSDYGFETIEQLLSMLRGKWKIQIIYHLSGNPTIRYGALKRKIPEISHKVLSAQLKELEKKRLIARIDYQSKIPKVEYSLTELGKSLLPTYESFGKWYEENRHLLSLQ